MASIPLKKNYHCLVLAPMLHRDPAAWGPNPEVFNPDNFSREAEAARPTNAYKPFGNGQRACIGRQFALQEAALVLGMILQRFKLIDHKRYQLKIKEVADDQAGGPEDPGASAHRSRADGEVLGADRGVDARRTAPHRSRTRA